MEMKSILHQQVSIILGELVRRLYEGDLRSHIISVLILLIRMTTLILINLEGKKLLLQADKVSSNTTFYLNNTKVSAFYLSIDSLLIPIHSFIDSIY